MNLEVGESAEVVLDIVPSTEFDINGSYSLGSVDSTSLQGFLPKSIAKKTSSLSNVTIIPAVTSGHVANLKEFRCKNVGTANARITLNKRSGGITYLEISVILEPGDALMTGSPWFVLTDAGITKTDGSGATTSGVPQHVFMVMDACLKALGRPLTHGLNSFLAPTRHHTTDSLLKQVFTRDHSFDSLLAPNTHYTIDALLKAVDITKTYTTDSLLFGSEQVTYTADSLIKMVGALLVTGVDGYLVHSHTKTHTLDSYIEAASLLTHTTNAALKALGTAKTHTIDAVLSAEPFSPGNSCGSAPELITETYYTPVLGDILQGQDNWFKFAVNPGNTYKITISYTSPAGLQAEAWNSCGGVTPTGQYTDFAINLLSTGTGFDTYQSSGGSFDYGMFHPAADADMYIYYILINESVSQEVTSTIDSLLFKAGLTKTGTLDACLKLIVSKVYTSDSCLKATETQTSTLDSALKGLGIAKTSTLDSALKALGTAKTHTLDACIQAVGTTKTHTLDSYLASGTHTDVYTSSTSWTPNFSGNVTMKCWGGGAGGEDGFMAGGQGGGGGAYSESVISVTNGTQYDIGIGAGGAHGGFAGGDTTVSVVHVGNLIMAKGGGFPTGGAAASGTGTIKHSGGNGGSNGGGTGGGGGGSSSGNAADGNNGANASGTSGGAGGTAPTGGYAGAAGGNNGAAGNDAGSTNYGGGGGGAGNGGGNGGAGKSGRVEISY